MSDEPPANRAYRFILERVQDRSARERVALVPEGTRKLPPRLLKSSSHFKTREAAEAAAAALKAQHDNVVTHIRELCQQTEPLQLKLSEDWPLQRRSDKP